ncbi:MAG: glycosyltransferase family 4 protein [Acidobacteria bacterium]|nr:glycosyltransferase family 4 protein [Acidobacteriota bacterium]MYJ06340.1 glycosyltransferase family 4 protein [Acidobacteriota bacterium]
MRILTLTAGAGGMYCGSCIRDNTLAQALTRLGHEPILVPLYTPPRTDEPSASSGRRIFFGGVSVFLEQQAGFFRGTPWLVDRLWDSRWLLRLVSKLGMPTQPEALGALTVSMLEGRHGHQRKEFDKLLHWLRTEPRPDVVDISYSLLISLAPELRAALDRPICCTLQGEDIFLDHLVEPYHSRALALIRQHAQAVDRFIAVSDYYAGHMAEYLQIPGAKIDVVPLGITADNYPPQDRGEKGDAPFTIGYLGRIAPEKGVHLLADAYHRLRSDGQLEGSRLELAGWVGPEHRGYLDGILASVRERGLGDAVHYRGVLELEDKVAFLGRLDLFAVPATYDDPKGLSLIEAMACGTPVVAARRGTYVELLERTGGGVLIPPDDIDALTETLRCLHEDGDSRRELATRGAAATREHYTAEVMARRALDVYRRLTERPEAATA